MAGSAVPATSIERRTLIAFTIYGALLLGVLSAATIATMAAVEDEVLSRRLIVEMDRLEAQRPDTDGLESSGTDRLTDDREPSEPSRFFEAYWGTANVPATLRQHLPPVEAALRNAEQLELEANALYPGSPNLFVGRRLLADGSLLIVTYNTSVLEAQDGWWTRLFKVFSFGLVACVLVTVLVASRLTRFVASPLASLEKTLRGDRGAVVAQRLVAESYPREIRSVVDALAGALNKNEDLMARERRFTRQVSHELRNPLAAVRGAAELMSRRGGSAHAVQLRRIERSCESMHEISTVMLALARQQNSQAEPEELSVYALLEEAAALLYEQEAFEWHNELASDITVTAEPGLLRIALSNLLSNAVQNLTAGGQEVSAFGEDGWVAIRDSGVGIDPQLARRFNRGDDVEGLTGRAGGCGIGLSLLRDICDRAGWRVTLESAAQSGTVAKIVFAPPSGSDHEVV